MIKLIRLGVGVVGQSLLNDALAEDRLDGRYILPYRLESKGPTDITADSLNIDILEVQ